MGLERQTCWPGLYASGFGKADKQCQQMPPCPVLEFHAWIPLHKAERRFYESSIQACCPAGLLLDRITGG